MSEANYTEPTDRLNLKKQQEEGYVPNGVLNLGETPPLSDNGYVGVDPVYQNFANETEKPYVAEEGPLADVEKALLSEDADPNKASAEQGGSDEDEEEEEDSTPSGSVTPPSTGFGQSS